MRNIGIFPVGLFMLLAACGRESGHDQKVESATVAAVPVAAQKAQSLGAPPALTIQVFREDSDVGVEADVDRLDDTGTAHWFADVDHSGVVTRDEPCKSGERFQATPKVPAFLRTAPQVCAATITFHLYSTQTTYALMRVADNAAAAGDLLVAQANYGLAAERLRYAQPEQAERLNLLATVAAGTVLGVKAPVATVDGREVISTEVVETLKAYQRQASLPETGTLDSATREAIGKLPREDVIEYARETPLPPPDAVYLEWRTHTEPAQIEDVPLSPGTADRATTIQRDIQRAKGES